MAKKIWTRSVFQYNKKTRLYELNENESDFIFVADDAPITLMKGGSSQPSSTTTTNSEPWSGVQPYLLEAFKRGAEQFLYPTPGPSFSQESKTAQDMQWQRAMAGNPLLGQGQQEIADTISGKYLTGGAGYDAALEAAKNKIIPGIESKFSGAGRLNSGLGRTAEASAIGDAFASQYGAERDRQQQAALAAPGMSQADYFDIAKGSEVGAQKDQMNEAQRNEKRNQILQFLQAISGGYGSQGTATTIGSSTKGSPWASALGGGIAGGMQYGPWGAAAGGALGLLSNWM